MPLFTLPLALLGLASLPAVVAIYWLRNRLKRQEVSSLHLWMGQREAREGGQRVQKLQLPWLLILEMLALLLLVFAATDPRVLMGQQQRQLVVVLDDSFSMQAGGREHAQKQLIEIAADESPLAMRLVLAREEPLALTSLLTEPSQVSEAIEGWKCQAMAADLDRAIALAYELGGEQGRVLVLTDRLPLAITPKPRLKWMAQGEAQANIAIINAVRTDDQTSSQGERVLVEVANLWREKSSTQLRVNDASMSLDLEPGEVHRLWLEVKDPTVALAIRLSDDALLADNHVMLLPPKRSTVRVSMNVGDEQLRGMLNRAVKVSRTGQVVEGDGDLLLTDQAAGMSSAKRWLVRWQVEEDAAAFVGPFLKDEHHPLMDGLALEGVVWGAKQVDTMPGRTLLAAGNTPLVSAVDRSGPRGSQFDVHVRLNPSVSTVGSTPAFPVLLWNLLAWRQQSLPGLSQTNVRLGSQVTFTPWRAGDGAGVESAAASTQPASAANDAATDTTSDVTPLIPVVEIISPDGKSRQVQVHGQSVRVMADQPGVYELLAGERRYELASNVMSREESDMTALATQTLGSWETTTTLRTQYTSIAWLLLLGALGVLVLHTLLAWRSAGGVR